MKDFIIAVTSGILSYLVLFAIFVLLVRDAPFYVHIIVGIPSGFIVAIVLAKRRRRHDGVSAAR